MASSVRVAIADLLEASDELMAIASGIHHQEAPEKAAYPFVLFFKQSGTPRWAMQGPPVRWQLWTVKGVGKSSEQLEQIDELLDAILTDGELDLDGAGTLYLRREMDVSYPETVGAITYRHLGAVFRVVTSPAG